ncbi:MAG TPA: helix-turn-helix domain-containing protein [Jatrophihabitans sp.]|nr:helix-turn-helix domain-containing protein [Jatrophihabitans sp.]
MTPAATKRAAHRPSRRHEIIEAATTVFAREGYLEANVEDIAMEAGVAPTAIYYHFGGKEELFAQTLRAALNGFSDAIFRVRPDSAAGSIENLRSVLRAGWGYWSAHQDAARLVARSSEGSTAHALQRRREWEQRHLERAYDYAPEARTPRSARKAREQHAVNTLAMGVLLDIIIVSQAAAIEGALERVSRAALISAVEQMCVALIVSLR